MMIINNFLFHFKPRLKNLGLKAVAKLQKASSLQQFATASLVLIIHCLPLTGLEGLVHFSDQSFGQPRAAGCRDFRQGNSLGSYCRGEKVRQMVARRQPKTDWKGEQGRLEELAFSELSREWQRPHPREIKIRGFLYRKDHGEWLLSAEPGLKSCCIGRPQKINLQIIVQGNIPETAPSPATLAGTLVIEEGRFHLLNSSLLTEKEVDFPVGTLFSGAAIGLLASGFYYLRSRKRRV